MTSSPWTSFQPLTNPTAESFPYFVIVLITILIFYSLHGCEPNAPLLNPKKPFELTQTRSKREYILGAGGMLQKWFSVNPNKPARLISDTGQVTVLPPHMAAEIRNDERLSFSKFLDKMFHTHLPGFEGFVAGASESHIVQTVVMKDLTKFLKHCDSPLAAIDKVTEPLAEETAMPLPELFTNDKEWRTIPLQETILQLIARISSRVFIGEELCRNEAWLRITQEYTITGFGAAEELALWPNALRTIVHWFLPACRKARAQVAEARQIIRPFLEERRKLKRALEDEGKAVAPFNDAVEWFEEAAKETNYDPATTQLNIAIAAIHTTTDLLCQVIADLAQHPDILDPLRKEIAAVLHDNGWKKISLLSMKLLDSVIKESQRMKPIAKATLRRVAIQDIELSDGTFIPKNGMLAVSSHRMWDPEVHDNPSKWDGYRFFKMREKLEQQNMAYLVTTSPDHLAFGHGRHACPGRFFAANEVKIALIFILMKYDLKLSEGHVPKIRPYGFNLGTDPFVKVDIRRREEEIELW